jgi:hypothetical protein
MPFGRSYLETPISAAIATTKPLCSMACAPACR